MPFIAAAAALAIAAAGAGQARASIQSPPKVHDRIQVLAAYVASFDTTDFTGDAPWIRIDVTADDPHDTLLVYTTNQPCAHTVQGAMNMVQYGTDGDLLASLDVGSGALDMAWYDVAHERYTYQLVGFSHIPEQTGQYSTLCTMLFDATGDPPQSLYPRGIAQNHVWATAQARMPIGTPGTYNARRLAA
jgi:hypothetical protein